MVPIVVQEFRVNKPFTMLVVGLMTIAVAGLSACNSSNPADAEKQAVAAANEWLGLLDSGKYEDAWNNSDDAIKGAGSKEQFAKAMAHMREPLGKENSRQLRDKAYAKDPQNAPPGEYVQIHFRTSFQNANSVIELVTLKKQPDGTWKIGQYVPNQE